MFTNYYNLNTFKSPRIGHRPASTLPIQAVLALFCDTVCAEAYLRCHLPILFFVSLFFCRLGLTNLLFSISNLSPLALATCLAQSHFNIFILLTNSKLYFIFPFIFCFALSLLFIFSKDISIAFCDVSILFFIFWVRDHVWHP